MKLNKRILVTRATHQASALADCLRALGVEPILVPTIEIVDPSSFAALDAALTRLASSESDDRFHWLVFTSANAVEAFHRRFQRLPNPYSLIPNPYLVAAIGPATSRALEAIGLKPDLLPPQAVAESLADALLPHARQPDGSPTRFLLIRAEQAREHLPETLRAAGADVTIAPVYRTVVPEGSAEALRELFARPEDCPDAITFTSSSTASNFFALLEAASIALPSGIVRASIGPVTSATLRELGHPPQVESTVANVTALAEVLLQHLQLRD
ncbi:MAG: uroporphyrinogen-III synthase [Acidobacteriaceae bacterium]